MPEGDDAEVQQPPKEEQEAKEPPKQEDAKEDDPEPEEKADEKKQLIGYDPLKSEPYVPTEQSVDDKYTLTPCCCCLCACSHDRVGDATCCGCLPIRCGILFIAIQIFALALILIVFTFFQLLNEYLPWWFVFITLLLLIPAAIAAMQMVYFFGKDTRSTRGTIQGGIILAIISIALWCIWQLIFFLAIYKKDTVYIGMGAANDDTNYHATPKRTYIFTVLAETAFILVFLTYYTCVSNQYKNLMNDAYDRQKREDDEEKERQEKAKKEKEKKEAADKKAAEKAKKQAKE